MASKLATLRAWHLAINLLAFGVSYPLANFLAQQGHVSTNIAFDFERSLPFLPWMILPYTCASILFGLSFAIVPDAPSLRLFSQRALFATVLATLVFAFFPLRFGFVRPAIDSPVLAALYDMLLAFDKPYNQLPSLHIAYSVIVWPALRPALPGPITRAALAALLFTVALSTVFTFQHHLLDVVAGLALGMGACLCVRRAGHQPRVAFYYLMAALWLLPIAWQALHSVLGLYVAFSLALVALAYGRERRAFLGKQNGNIPLRAWLLYAPYLAGYWLSWQVVRWHGRHRPPFFELAPGLWVGRRLSAREAAALPAGCAIIDLANELSESAPLRMGHYWHCALLDLVHPDPTHMQEVAKRIAGHSRQGRPVYLHCAMGYSRCIVLANYYLETIAE